MNRGGEVSFLGVVTSDPAPLRAAATAGAEVKAEAAPTDRASPWPQFRGPQASGVGDGQGAPAAWNVATGEGVRFKTPIPGIGLSSPIVWGDRIFLTTAVSGKGDTTFRTGLYGDSSSVDDHLRAFLPRLRARRRHRPRDLGAQGLSRRAQGAAPPQVEPRQRHSGHRRRARRRALRRDRQARGLRLRGQAALAARHRHPRLPTIRSPAAPSGGMPARPSSMATWCSCRETGARTPSSPPIAWRRARKSGGWRAKSSPPGRRPTSSRLPRATS